MSKLVISTIAFAGGVLIAHAASAASAGSAIQNVRTVNFYTSGACDGEDNLDPSKPHYNPADEFDWSLLRASGPVMITSINFTVNFGGQDNILQYAGAGNSDPMGGDIMVWASPVLLVGQRDWGAGTGSRFAPGDHIDLHVSCTSRTGEADAGWQGFYTVGIVEQQP